MRVLGISASYHDSAAALIEDGRVVAAAREERFTQASPYMLLTAKVRESTNPRYHALLTAFQQKTGCPVLVNTSFNVRGEPIVCTPEDAWRCFLHTGMDALAMGNCLLLKGKR